MLRADLLRPSLPPDGTGSAPGSSPSSSASSSSPDAGVLASTKGLVPCLLGATTLGKLGRRAMRRGPC